MHTVAYRFRYKCARECVEAQMEIQDTARRRATRARLVEAAIGEFGRNGIDATSVEQVCEAAGFSRGAFYSNFSSKDDLCIEVARQAAEEAALRFRDVLASMPEHMGTDDIVAAILDVADLTPELHTTQVELALRAARHPGFGERYRATRADLWPLYVEVMEQAAERAGVDLLVPLSDVVQIMEALHLSPQQIGNSEESRRLITLVTHHLITPSQGATP